MMSFACGIVGIALFVLAAPALQFYARRAAPQVSPVILLAAAAAISLLIMTSLGATMLGPFQFWNAASVFAFGVMAYVFAFGAVHKSVSLEILLALTVQPGRKAAVSDIVERQVRDIFRQRTEILVAGGLANRRGLAFEVTPAGRRLARQTAIVRKIFGIGNTGLYDFNAPPPHPEPTTII